MTLGDTAGIFNSCASHDARLLGDIGRPITNSSTFLLGNIGVKNTLHQSSQFTNSPSFYLLLYIIRYNLTHKHLACANKQTSGQFNLPHDIETKN